MREALEYAVILTEKHKELNKIILASNRYRSKVNYIKKRNQISNEIIPFLIDLNNNGINIFLDPVAKEQFIKLKKYYCKEIFYKIKIFETNLNLINFEENYLDNSYAIQKKINYKKYLETEISNYYQIFK